MAVKYYRYNPRYYLVRALVAGADGLFRLACKVDHKIALDILFLTMSKRALGVIGGVLPGIEEAVAEAKK